MFEILSPLTSTHQEGMDVERFTAELPGLAAGRQTLFDEMARLAKADVELTVSGHADLYRGVSPESGSPFPGPWRTDRVPCLREPMDCLHPDHPSRRVTLKFSAQTGKSEVGVNWFCYIVDRTPGPMLTVLPTGAESVKYNRVKIQPTIDVATDQASGPAGKLSRRGGVDHGVQEVFRRFQSDRHGEFVSRIADDFRPLAHPR
jgi:hypothetical protein